MKRQYWLFGGIIGVLIPVFTFAFATVMHIIGLDQSLSFGISHVINMVIWFGVLPGVLPGEYLSNYLVHCGSDGIACGIVVYVMSGLVMYFMAGSVVGYLYGYLRGAISSGSKTSQRTS
jgi:hypothetical protein